MKRIALIFGIFVLSAGLVFSADLGLLIDQKVEAQNDGVENESFVYSPSLTPWFSWNGGRGLSVYLSGILSMQYNNIIDDIDDNDGWGDPLIVPELARFGMTYRAGQRFSIEVGRIPYSDVTGFVASGLFDGVMFRAGGLSVGAFYTGLLYRETAKILMTQSDVFEPWDWDNFGEYFASRRLLASVRYDMPLMEYHNLSFELAAQFDLNGAEDKLHSQYGEAQVEFFISKMSISFGAIFEAMENGNGDFTAGLGALAGLRMEVPGGLNDAFKLTGKFGSGQWNDTFTGFTPVGSYSQGSIISETISGLWLAKAAYDVRFLSSLVAEASFGFFGRTYDDPAADSMLHGGELWASLAWQPLDDIRLSLGGGVFFPVAGDTDPMWKVSAGLSLSF